MYNYARIFNFFVENNFVMLREWEREWRVASVDFKIYEMQIPLVPRLFIRNGRERKFLATIISSLSGLYRAIIESLKPEPLTGYRRRRRRRRDD